MRALKIYETIGFKRDQNPYNKLDIGPKTIIDNWFKQWVPDVDYEIDDNLNITVNGYLYLWDSKVTKLPDNLTINGSLWLKGSKITKLPDNLKVDKEIYKDFE